MEQTNPFLPLFQSLGTKVQAKKHDCLYNRAHMDNYVYYLVDGLCALHSVSPNGKERIYQYFMPGDLVGFIPAYQRSYPDETFFAFSITAKSTCTLYQISYPTFREYIEEHPEFYRWLFETTVSHYDNALRHCYTLQDGNNFISLCQAVGELAIKEHSRLVLQKDFSHQELANYLGIHTITVTRLIGRLKNMGIIAKEGHLTVILDRVRLAALARGEIEHS